MQNHRTPAELKVLDAATAYDNAVLESRRSLEGKLDLILEAVRNSRDEARGNRRCMIASGWVISGAWMLVIMLWVALRGAR